MFDLLDENGDLLRSLQSASYEDPCGDLKVENWHLLKNNWAHLQDLPLPKPVGDGVVDLVLGSSAMDLMEAVKPVIFGPPGGPVAKVHGPGMDSWRKNSARDRRGEQFTGRRLRQA